MTNGAKPTFPPRRKILVDDREKFLAKALPSHKAEPQYDHDEYLSLSEADAREAALQAKLDLAVNALERLRFPQTGDWKKSIIDEALSAIGEVNLK